MRYREQFDLRRIRRSQLGAPPFLPSTVTVTRTSIANCRNHSERGQADIFLNLIDAAQAAIEILEKERERDSKRAAEKQRDDAIPFVRRPESRHGRQRLV